MTKKLPNPLEDPPTASSSDEDDVETSAGEEEEEEEEDEVSSSEEDEPKDSVKASSNSVTVAIPGKTTVSAATKENSDSDSGSETETDSDSETNRSPNPPLNQESKKAIAVSSAAQPKKKEAQPSAQPSVKSGTKRPNEGASKEQAKKVKSGDEEKKIGEDSKKPAFQRLWTEEDEITVLQGMIDFKADKGKSPYEDTNGYYDFIKKSISFEVSKNQFMDKIRSLKKKYMGKEKPSFTKPHDQKSLKLCKYIWGPEGMALESAVKSNGVSKKSQKSKKIESVKQQLSFPSSPNGKTVEEDKKVLSCGGDLESDWFENSFLVGTIAGFGVDEHTVKERWRLVPVENKKKVEEKFKILQANEFDFVMQKTEFLHQVTSMIAEASKNI